MEQDGLEKVFNGANKLTYATSIDGIPNLRIVNFVWEKERLISFTLGRFVIPKGSKFLSSEKIAFQLFLKRKCSCGIK